MCATALCYKVRALHVCVLPNGRVLFTYCCNLRDCGRHERVRVVKRSESITFVLRNAVMLLL